jgi:hypothetical protein
MCSLRDMEPQAFPGKIHADHSPPPTKINARPDTSKLAIKKSGFVSPIIHDSETSSTTLVIMASARPTNALLSAHEMAACSRESR